MFPCLCSPTPSSETPHPTPTFWSSCNIVSFAPCVCTAMFLFSVLSPSQLSYPTFSVALPSASLPADLWVSEWSPGGGEPLSGTPAVEWKQGLAGCVHHCAQCHPEWFRPLYLQRVPGVWIWGTSPLCEDHTANPPSSHRGGWDWGTWGRENSLFSHKWDPCRVQKPMYFGVVISKNVIIDLSSFSGQLPANCPTCLPLCVLAQSRKTWRW